MALGITRLFDVTSIIGKSLRMRMFWWLGSIPQGKNKVRFYSLQLLTLGGLVLLLRQPKHGDISNDSTKSKTRNHFHVRSILVARVCWEKIVSAR